MEKLFSFSHVTHLAGLMYMSNYYNVPILATGVFLKMKSPLEQGDYSVVLRVFDQHSMSQDNTIQVKVCDCEGDSCLETFKFCLR